LQYHSSDQYATSETEAKVKEYKVRGFPTMFFNGGNETVGGGEGNYNQYKTMVSSLLTRQSFIRIVGQMTASGGSISIKATVINSGNNPITDVKFMAVVYEDIGTEEHHYVVQDILPPSEVISLAPAASREFSLNSDFLGSSPNLKVVLFLQATSGEILQAALATSE
jgi:hypothetical protein